MYIYSDPTRAADAFSIPDIEIFYTDRITAYCDRLELEINGQTTGPGWYWWYCQPGCLPDGEAAGPFETYDAVLRDLDLLPEAGTFPSPTEQFFSPAKKGN